MCQSIRTVCIFLHLEATFFNPNRLVGLVVRRPPRERKVPGSNPAYAGIFFGVESLQWLPCLTLGVMGLALGLVGPVSV